VKNLFPIFYNPAPAII